MRSFPSLDQATSLPRGPLTEVPAAYGDVNGHLNVRNHLALYDDAEWDIFAGLGMGEAEAAAGIGGVFALEQHLTYRREVLVGDRVAVHVRALARTDRLLHLVSYLVNHSRGEVAGSMEAREGWVDFSTRRLAPWPAEAAAGLDAAIADAGLLPWQPALRGCLTSPG